MHQKINIDEEPDKKKITDTTTSQTAIYMY